ncbi:uncharacterized protein LOC143590316 [Bidens hawaiensis]|uniref:uncharacterized protein LOC143590316 n=1 Tax=Bidens hawaiensis TaxID=980011 RepID=UPI004048F1BF
MRQWVVEHKLRAVGSLWLSGIAGSIAYNWSKPGMKTSVRIIHASFRYLFSRPLKAILCWWSLKMVKLTMGI